MSTDEPAAPGALLGQGRHADVFEHGPGTVLRRYRTGQPAGPEAELMAHARRHGYPAPEVVAVDGASIVMERVDGPSLLQAMVRRPHRLAAYAALLVDLHRRLHAIDAPASAARPFGGGESLLHLDLHPGNVVLSDRGPVVLDWGYAAAGPPAFDLAHTWLEMATAEVPAGGVTRVVGAIGRGAFIRLFVRRLDRPALVAALPDVARYRFEHRSLTDLERVRIERFVARVSDAADA